MNSKISNGMVLLLAILAIGGGIYFGLFSCGGYIWHKQLHISLMAIVAIVILIAPPSSLLAIWKRTAFIAISLGTFIVVRAAASAFYPASPESLSKFMESFTIGLQYGPC